MDRREAIRRLKEHFEIHNDRRPTPYLDEAARLAYDALEKYDQILEKFGSFENVMAAPITFKVGDIVWVYDPMWGIIPAEVDRPYHCRCGEEGGCTFEMSFSEADIDKYVFAIKEYAEDTWLSRKAEED